MSGTIAGLTLLCALSFAVGYGCGTSNSRYEVRECAGAPVLIDKQTMTMRVFVLEGYR
jgi:hypothetical protein